VRVEHVLGSEDMFDIDEKVTENENITKEEYPANERGELNHG
jgi:hypothetical protein